MTTKQKITALAKECGLVGYYLKQDDFIVAFYHAAQKEALSNARVNVPTDAMEQAFQQYHTMGYKKGKKEALEQVVEVFEDSTQSNVLFTVYQVAEELRKLIKE